MSRTEVESVIDYVFTHSRGNPNGRAFKVYRKMFEFISGAPAEQQAAVPTLFDLTNEDMEAAA